MSNTIMTLQEIARQALPQLMENLIFPNLCYRDFSEEFHDLGDTVKIRKPAVFTAEDFNAETGVNYQELAGETVDVSLNHLATVDAHASAIESAVDIDDLNRAFIGPAAAALAEKINADGMKLYRDIPHFTGAPGVTPSTLADLAAARHKLNMNKAPAYGRVAVWDPEADVNFAQIPALINAEKGGESAALREGAIGRVFGMDNYMSQAVCRHSVGTAISSGCKLLVDGAAPKGAAYIHIDGGSGAETLEPGDILTIGGVDYAVEKQCVFSGGEGDVYVCGGVKADIADNTGVAYVGSADAAEYTNNLAFHPMAFAYVTRPLLNPDGQGVASYVTSYNGVSLRVTKGYDQQYKRSIYSMDVLYGFKTVYPELAVRALG
ncbi:MAG: P22 coat protein [Clostridia bacterium]|nr:P22 coat protein [Clostridia bacterium]